MVTVIALLQAEDSKVQKSPIGSAEIYIYVNNETRT